MADSKFLSIDPLGSAQMAQIQNSVANAQKLATSTNAKFDGKLQTPQSHEEQIKKAATQFEAMLVNEMLKSMQATVPQGGFLSGSKEESTYQDMFHEALANSIAEHQSIGVKDVIIRDIKATEARQNKALAEKPKKAS